jgi:predicted dehydrogenase
MEPVKLLIIGAGNRGTGYATYAHQHPEQAAIVGVAEPREHYRNQMASTYQIPAGNVFVDWKDALDRPKFADAAIVATQDAMHVEPAIALLNKGYHLLLEKPMAPNEADCRRVVEAALSSDVVFAVAHVLRYTPYTRKLKTLLDSGIIGDIVSIQHLEPIGYWHFAHSYVRGNWRNKQESSPILLSKSCHDLDWIRYIMGTPCTAISSFGSLKHFHKEHKPANATDRCVECEHEPQCPYSARKIYLERAKRGEYGWPIDVITPVVTPESVEDAIRTGPYGRCVYACDNDVLDNQVVNMLFEGDKTATFTMCAFTRMGDRRTSIFGTQGELYGNGEQIRYTNFLNNQTDVIDTRLPEDSILQGHGGGDYGLMQHFIAAVAENDPDKILSGPEETLETHVIVFAAERARTENSVISLNSYHNSNM